MNDTSELEHVSGIGPEYARLLEAAGITTLVSLRDRLSTDENRKLVSWQTGISERLLLRWYQHSYEGYDPSEELTRDGLSCEEAAMLVGVEEEDDARPFGLVAPDGALPLTASDGRRVQDGPVYKLRRRVAHLKVFTFSTVSVLALLLVVLLYGFLKEALVEDDPGLVLGTGSSAEVRARLAERLFHEKSFEEAEREYRQALLLDTGLVSARTGLGRTLYRLERYSDAVAELEKAIKLDSRSFEAHYFLSNVLIQTRELERAMDEARKALELLPDHPWAAYNLALVSHMSNGKLKLSGEEFQLAVATLIREAKDSAANPTLQGQTVAVLRSLTHKSFGYDPSGTPESRDAAVESWRRWWEARQRPPGAES